MRKYSEGEIRVRCAEAERGFLAGVKEMVKMRAEMGVMPWGKHVFYPRMLHKARPQKVSDFLVDDSQEFPNVFDSQEFPNVRELQLSPNVIE